MTDDEQRAAKAASLVRPGTVAPFPHEVRAVEPGDVGFVVSSWLESFHKGSRIGRMQRFALYRLPMRRLIHRLLERSTVLVAVDVLDRTHIFGWVCAERLTAPSSIALHYLYVRETRRKVGLGRELVELVRTQLDGQIVAFTHATDLGVDVASRWWQQGAPEADFNPFLAWEPSSKESAA